MLNSLYLRTFLRSVIPLLLLASCAPTRYVKPLSKGEQAIQANFGGPLAKVPGIGVIPLPLSAVGYGYGVSDRITVFGNLHTTSLLFGIGQTDIGAVYRVWQNQIMGLSIQPTLNASVDFYTGTNRFWPQLDANYYWDYSAWKTKPKNGQGFTKKNTVYGGLSNWFDPYATESQGRKNEQFWIPSLQLGHMWQKNQWIFQVETKVLAPIYSNENIVVDYPSLLGKRGALGVYFSTYYTLK